MSLRNDNTAASPLVVIATFVAVAVVLTAGAYWLFLDKPDRQLRLVEERSDDGGVAFNVTLARGGLEWSTLKVRFLDRAGADHAATFLTLPPGSVTRGDTILVEPLPPSGSYVLVVTRSGAEMARLSVVF